MQNTYLCHHGVKGMKWGIRKGPPYPLGSGGMPNPFNTPVSSIARSTIDTGKMLIGRALDGDPIDYGIKNPNAYNVLMDWYDREISPEEKTIEFNGELLSEIMVPRPPERKNTEGVDPDFKEYARDRDENQESELTPTTQSVYDRILDSEDPLFEQTKADISAKERKLQSLMGEHNYEEAAQVLKELDQAKRYKFEQDSDYRDERAASENTVDERREAYAKSYVADYENTRALAEKVIGDAFEANAPRLDHEETSEESMAAINPKHGQVGYTDNCTGCSMAFTLRKQGYDVQAGSFDKGVQLSTITNDYFTDAPGFTRPRDDVHKAIESVANGSDEDKKRAAASAVEASILSSSPNGSYGFVEGGHANGLGGHSVAYEVKDNHVTYYDGQVNKKYDNTYDFVEQNRMSYDAIEHMRTDNLTPNWMKLGRAHRIERAD